MIFKLLSCDVLVREVSYCIARCPHTIRPVFTPKGEHNKPTQLRANLQSQIDAVAAEEQNYDAVLLGYGLCGNAISGLIANKYPLVIPRAHDCTTLFLGSRQDFKCHFADNPSQTWAAVGYSEGGDTVMSDNSTRDFLGLGQDYAALVEQYGEENAKYLIETMLTEHGSDSMYLIDIPETTVPEITDRIRKAAADAQLKVVEIAGSLRLIQGLLAGSWSPEDYLVVPPGHRITGIYDYEEVMTAQPAEERVGG
ncbi:MAG: DUF1638 domain-containing protein [Candidatus Hydrogenedentes bacterium]|nr:DUF1638 domain-containing protein [Candidatus Hydrogenedentota bacterium]